MHSLQSLESTVQHRSVEQAACQPGGGLMRRELRGWQGETVGQG
jgi:hypothetical protein